MIHRPLVGGCGEGWGLEVCSDPASKEKKGLVAIRPFLGCAN